MAAPVPDHIERTADICDAQLFPDSLNVFHCPDGDLVYFCNFDKTHMSTLLSLVSSSISIRILAMLTAFSFERVARKMAIPPPR